MNIYAFPPIAAVLDGAYSVVTALSSALVPIAGSASAAVAIVLVTLLIRGILIPVGISQVRAENTRRRLAPQLKELQRKYQKNRELLQRKTMEFYAAEKASPLAGCLPTLAQAPVLSAVYGLFVLAIINGHPNILLMQHLAGVPLGMSLFGFVGGATLWPGITVFLVVLALIAFVATMNRRVSTRLAASNVSVDSPTMSTIAGWMSWLPFITVVLAAVVPLAASLYLAVTTSWTLAERVTLRRLLQ